MNCLNVEELLIDFRELIGSHSGINLAAAVWSTMELYGLEGRVSFPIHMGCKYTITDQALKVLAINCDNASNNDTMMEELEKISTSKGYPFDATEARLRCMPHTVHLAALEASR